MGNPDFAIIRAAYPYISERLLTDQSPRMKETLRYLIYGKEEVQHCCATHVNQRFRNLQHEGLLLRECSVKPWLHNMGRRKQPT